MFPALVAIYVLMGIVVLISFRDLMGKDWDTLPRISKAWSAPAIIAFWPFVAILSLWFKRPRK